MKISFPLILAFCTLVLFSCRSKEGTESGKSENNIDAARNFIRSALDGKFDEARKFLVGDSVNTNYMDVAERAYQKAAQDIKDGYRSSSINIHKVDNLNDSTSVVIYSNSFRNDHDTLKVLRKNGQWLVDLKYLYQHDQDTTVQKTVTSDTLQ